MIYYKTQLIINFGRNFPIHRNINTAVNLRAIAFWPAVNMQQLCVRYAIIFEQPIPIPFRKASPPPPPILSIGLINTNIYFSIP